MNFFPLVKSIANWLVLNAISDSYRAVYWLPVFFALGCAIYFALPFEPATAYIFWPCFGFGVIKLLKAKGYFKPPEFLNYVLSAVICIFLGLLLAQFRTQLVATPLLSEKIGPVHILGDIVQIDRESKGGRIILDRLEWVDQPRVEVIPLKIRLRVRSNIDELAVGQRVHVLAVLSSPTEPALPGGYDFARQQYFDGIGAVGFTYGKPKITGQTADSDWRISLNQFRDGIIKRINEHLDGDVAAVSTALITSEQSGVSPQTMQELRQSGLQHILSVSGLHLTLVGGLIFLVTRFLLIWIPGLAIPSKKIAALLAIFATFFYLIISGFAIATIRSFLMIAVVFLAILVDREALSMRLVALAAAIILLFMPESIFSISFQLSFAAVVALISVYESWPESNNAKQKGWLVRACEFFLLTAFTSLIASVSTAPIILYHFHQITAQGILANMLVNPLVSFWIMPMAILVLLGMPFGLEQIPLQLMGIGVDGMIKISSLVAAMPGALIMVPAISSIATLMMVGGGLWLLLWLRPWRYLGLAPILAGICLAFYSQLPDILISSSGKLFGIYSDTGQFGVSSVRREKFTAKIWNSYYGQSQAVVWDDPQIWNPDHANFRCDIAGCALYRAGYVISFVHKPDILAEECLSADIVIVTEKMDMTGCQPNRFAIDSDFLDRHGAVAIYLSAAGIDWTSVGNWRGRRPWTRSLSKDMELDPAENETD